MDFTEKKLTGKTVYRGKILTVESDEVELCDKTVDVREVVRHSGGAAALLVENGCILLVKQFRYAYGKEIYEIPAGKINDGETPAQAAERELGEETGRSAKLMPLVNIYPSPGYTDEVIYIFFAENSTRSDKMPDTGEFLRAEFIPVGRVKEMIMTGEIADAKTVAAVCKYLAFGK